MIESDAVVTSTVPEGELAHPVTRKSAPPLSAADSAKPELSDLKSPPSLNGLGFGRVEGADGNSHKPAWRILSQLKSRDPLSDPAPDLSPGLDEARLTELQEQTYFTDFEIPEMEFDEFGLELAENRDSPPEASAFDHMGTGDLIDEDFERELGAAAKELSVQEVIDADFPDISRLGILQIAGDDKLGRKVIIFSACRLPAADLIDHQRLLLYITKTLEQYVSSDYCVIYFHFGLTRSNKPSFGWLVQAYRTLDRNFRKNLKALYIVHPTTGIKILWALFKPFVSSKMSRKVMYIEQLKDLEEYLFLNQLPVPRRVIDFDKLVAEKLKSTANRTGIEKLNADVSFAFAHNSVDAASVMSCAVDDQKDFAPDPQQQFNVSLQFIKMNNGGRTIPIVLEDTVDYLREFGLDTEGIFRRSVSVKRIRDLQEAYNRGEQVDLREYDDPHLAASLLKCFLRELSEPLLTFELYDDVLSTGNLHGREKVSAIKELILTKLPDDNYEILNYLGRFLTEMDPFAYKAPSWGLVPCEPHEAFFSVLQKVTEHSAQNKMTATNLAVVFGPSLIWSRHHASLGVMGVINAFTQLLITHYESIFIK